MTTIPGKCNTCCVPGCNSNSTPSFRNRGGRITTFKLPRDETRRKDWIQAIPKRKYPPTVNHNVCILHFNEEDFSRNSRRIDLKKNAIPSIFPFVDGQSNDEESTDICDEAWTEYVGYRKDSLKKAVENVDNKIPTQISDISRILIERLRITGSKYFGIDTAEITIETDSEFESESCEPKATTKTTKSSRKRKVNKSEPEANNSTDEFNVDEIDMTDSRPYVEECSDSERGNRFPIIESVNANTVENSVDVDTFGAMVKSKLLLMSPLQRLLSQKIISEILLKGQLGMLKSSLSPVLVAGYMTKSTTNVVASNDCLLPMCDDNSNDRENASDDCDPLMFQVKKKKIRGTESVI